MNQKGLAPILIVLLVVGTIGGYILYQKQYQPVSTQSSVDEIANWKTYTNNESNFEFKYPETWILLNNSASIVSIGDKEIGDGWFSVDKTSNNIDIESLKTCVGFNEPGAMCLEDGKKWGQASDIVDTKLANLSAKSFYIQYTGPGETVHVIQTIQEPILQIRTATFEWDSFKDIYNQILSTFKFTN